jgi:predicted component of type VI protein secretion system
MSARLVIQSGQNPGQVFALGNSSMVMGREPTNAIVISDPEISRQHTRIIPQGQGYLVEDLGSTNGTYVNGRRLMAATPLQHGDLVGLGETVKLIFELGHSDNNATIVQGSPIFEHLETVLPQPIVGAEMPAESITVMPSPTLKPKRSRRTLLLGCLGVLALAIVVLAAVVFYLDANNPDLLYAPLQPLFDLLNTATP